MNPQEAVPVNFGIQVADGENMAMSFHDEELHVTFDDWREVETRFKCLGVVSFRWQPIECFQANERPDSTYEIIHSAWLHQHREQGMIGSAQKVHHYKLNFNAMGCLEIICSEIVSSSDSTAV